MDGPLLNEYLATTTVGGLFACIGLAFLLVQERTGATLGMAVTFIAAGLDSATLPLVADQLDRDGVSLLERGQSLFDAGIPLGLVIYISGLLATTQSSSSRGEAMVRLLMRTGLIVAGLVAGLGLMFPVERANDLVYGLGDSGTLGRPGFWLFAGVYGVAIGLPYNLAILSFTFSMLLVLAGLYRYAIAQAERGVFLSRFLSPRSRRWCGSRVWRV